MNDDRQSECRGQFQLGLERPLLLFPRRFGVPVVIEADLSDGNNAFMGCQAACW